MRVIRGILVCATVAAATVGGAQSLNELNAVQAGQATLDAGSVTGGVNAGLVQDRARAAAAQANNPYGAVPPTGAIPNPAGGFAPPGAQPLPGAAPSFAPPGAASPYGAVVPGAVGPGAVGPGAIAPGAGFAAAAGWLGPWAVAGLPGVSSPTRIPQIEVLAGKRVYCAVCGSLLEDPIKLKRPETEKDKYLDDGIHDNGIANDGIRGNVSVSKDEYIGAECNNVKNRLINVVRRSEELVPASMIGEREPSPYDIEDYESRQRRLEAKYAGQANEESVMHFYRLHVATINPLESNPAMPKLLEKEQQRDELLRDWNARFLAPYRKDKNDPKSDFYQLYVPEPPAVPQYPVPPGYVSPQSLSNPQAGAPGAPGVPGAAPTPNIWNGQPVI